MSAHTELRVVKDQGKGRPFVLLHESGSYAEWVELLLEALVKRTRVLRVECPRINDQNWRVVSRALMELSAGQGLKQCSFVSFGAAGILLQDLGLTDVKQVRTAVFIDASTRPHPTRFQRLIDRLEEIMPLGLPLRLRTEGFDGRAFLHRIRCPALVVTGPASSEFHLHQAELMARHLPTAWRVHLESSSAELLCNLVCEFQDVPAKCPQKNGRVTASPLSAPVAAPHSPPT
ncbi:MAG: hypothetical protein QY326_05780 [Bdellovibrionota bacterium]|nr:MAG: hypothetical protein QY326_05780 [Bdellovibrionota bacterium]